MKFKTRAQYAEDHITERVLSMGYSQEVAEIVGSWAYIECGAAPVQAELEWRARAKTEELRQLREWAKEDRMRRIAAGLESADSSLEDLSGADAAITKRRPPETK